MRFILSVALLIAPAAITSAQPVAPGSFGRGSIDDAANFACR